MISKGSSGGDGISFGNDRRDARLFGDGIVTGGDGGKGVVIIRCKVWRNKGFAIIYK